MSVELLPVAFPMSDVQNGPQVAAVVCRIRTFVKLYVFDGIWIESGKETEGVGGIVERHLIQHYAGLIRSATTDVESAADV